jgi:hypothetical protein
MIKVAIKKAAKLTAEINNHKKFFELCFIVFLLKKIITKQGLNKRFKKIKKLVKLRVFLKIIFSN